MPPNDAPEPEKEDRLASALAENQTLRGKLEKYREVEEELVAQKVFENAKKKLLAWLTAGSAGAIVLGLFGFKQIDDYMKALVDKKMNTITEEKLADAIGRNVSNTVAAKEAYINVQIADAIGKFVASQPLRTASPSPSSTPGGLVGDQNRTSIDYSAQMTAVGNQENEGSTTGFAVAAALEYQIFKTKNVHVQISVRHIYYAARLAVGAVNVDAGATIKDAIDVLLKQGAVADDIWPYEAGQYAAKPPTAVSHARAPIREQTPGIVPGNRGLAPVGPDSRRPSAGKLIGALEPAERQFLAALNDLGVRYLVVGVTAASMQGARVATGRRRFVVQRHERPARRRGGTTCRRHLGFGRLRDAAIPRHQPGPRHGVLALRSAL